MRTVLGEVPTIPLADAALWEHSSPAGGFVRSAWVAPDDIVTGMVVRYRAEWRPVLAVRPAGFGVDCDLDRGDAVWVVEGVEARTDLRLR